MADPTPHQIDIVALGQFLDFIQSPNVDFVQTPQTGWTPLYHYTDLGGLQAIVESHDLWLINSRYSNDAEEMSHGQKVVAEVIARQVATPPEHKTFFDKLTEMTNEPQGVYICCFCDKDNLLSQWRGYGANGAGVCLKIDPSGFTSLTGADCQHGLLRLWRVFYPRTRQEGIVQSSIDYYLPASNPGRLPEDLARKAADAIQFFIPTFKNPDFSEENEWRLIFTPAPLCGVPLHFRVARNMLVPYFKLKELGGGALAALPIQAVLIGPSPHRALNVESAKTLLIRNGYLNVTVDASTTSYRA